MFEMADFSKTNTQGMHYRVTGKQSVERLDPLIKTLFPNAISHQTIELETKVESKPLDFVWETTCEKGLRKHQQEATVFNKLHNSQIIESKACLAYLQLLMSTPMLETWIATGASEVSTWAKKRWDIGKASIEGEKGEMCNSQSRDWWVVKASKGNGGRDVWIFNEENHIRVIGELAKDEEYVIQRY